MEEFSHEKNKYHPGLVAALFSHRCPRTLSPGTTGAVAETDGMMNSGYRMMNGGYNMMGGGYDMMNNYPGNIDNAAYQAFQQETAAIRSSMAADEAELNAIMAGANPDAKRARVLSESISDKQNQLAEAARRNNIQPAGSGLYCGSW